MSFPNVVTMLSAALLILEISAVALLTDVVSCANCKFTSLADFPPVVPNLAILSVYLFVSAIISGLAKTVSILPTCKLDTLFFIVS